jgi:L-asparagine transporter-like permease
VKIDWAFLRLVAYCVLGVVLLVVLPLSVYSNTEILQSVVASGVVSFLHLLLGYACIEFGFEKSNTTFLKIILGGTFIRMVLLVGIVFVLIRVYRFDTSSLMISFLLFFVLNLVLEIHLLQKKVALKR